MVLIRQLRPWFGVALFTGALVALIVVGHATGSFGLESYGTDSCGCAPGKFCCGGSYLGPKFATFEDGDYLVRARLPVGTYQASDARCHWARVTNFDGTRASIIAKGHSTIVTLSARDYGFHADGCGTWTDIG